MVTDGPEAGWLSHANRLRMMWTQAETTTCAESRSRQPPCSGRSVGPAVPVPSFCPINAGECAIAPGADGQWGSQVRGGGSICCIYVA